MSASETLDLFALNVSGPSTDRARRLGEYLVEVNADVLVLTETRGTQGTWNLIDMLRSHGYRTAMEDLTSAKQRGAAVLYRGCGQKRAIGDKVELSYRVGVADLEAPTALTVVGVYVPSRDASQAKILRKRRFLKEFLALISGMPADDNVVVMGDFNLINRAHEPRYSSFRSWEYEALERIANNGFRDCFAELHPNVQEHSWIGRTGNGYRYDYAFVCESFVDQLGQCEYVHKPRQLGLTDHAGVSLRLSLGTRKEASEPAVLTSGLA